MRLSSTIQHFGLLMGVGGWGIGRTSIFLSGQMSGVDGLSLGVNEVVDQH